MPNTVNKKTNINNIHKTYNHLINKIKTSNVYKKTKQSNISQNNITPKILHILSFDSISISTTEVNN